MSEREYSVVEAAKELGVSKRVLQHWIKKGKISAYKPNPLAVTSPYKIKQSTIDAFKELQKASDPSSKK